MRKLCCCLARRWRPPPEDGAEEDCYWVAGAGFEAANGRYTRSPIDRDGAPSYVNEYNTVLFRFAMPSGTRSWYLSDGDGDFRSARYDYYRARGGGDAPPLVGWQVAAAIHDVGQPPARLARGGRAPPPPQPGHPSRQPLLAALPANGPAWLLLRCSGGGGREGGGAGGAPAEAAEAVKQAEALAPAEPEEPVELTVSLLSGERLAALRVQPSATAREVRALLDPFLVEGRTAVKLVAGMAILRDDQSLKEGGLGEGGEVQAIIHAYNYLVTGAGSDRVNGRYLEDGSMNGAPCYRNEHGTRLFLYRFRSSGSLFWYFSDGKNLDTSHGDYYRVRSETQEPPLEGWKVDLGGAGVDPVPQLRRPGAGAEQPEAVAAAVAHPPAPAAGATAPPQAAAPGAEPLPRAEVRGPGSDSDPGAAAAEPEPGGEEVEQPRRPCSERGQRSRSAGALGEIFVDPIAQEERAAPRERRRRPPPDEGRRVRARSA